MSVQISQNSVLNILVVETNRPNLILPQGIHLAKGSDRIRFVRIDLKRTYEYLASDVTTVTDKDGNVTNIGGDIDLLFDTLNASFIFGLVAIKDPLPVSPQDSITLGSLIIPFDQLENIRRMNADLDATSTNDFTTFITSTGEYQVPSDKNYVVSITSFATDRRLSMSLGYADDATGLNFVELIDETVMSPQNNYSNETEFIFIIPSSKFPIVNNTANITSGFVILQGLESALAGAAAVLSNLPIIESSFSVIDKQGATNSLLDQILTRVRTRNVNNEPNVPNPITLNDTTAVKIADANSSRNFIEFSILPKMTDVCVFIRLYPALDDDLMRGTWIGRFNLGNNVFFRSSWRMIQDSIYPGEISAILLGGQPDEDIYITEY